MRCARARRRRRDVRRSCPRSRRTPSARNCFSSKALAPRPGKPFRLGIPALGEIPDALLAAAADDGDLAARVQDAEHQTHLARAPPAVRLALRRPVVLDLAREERPAPVELAQDVAPERGVLLQVRRCSRRSSGRSLRRMRACKSGRSSIGQRNAFHSTSFRSSQSRRSSSARS